MRKLVQLREQRKLSLINRIALWLNYLLAISLLISVAAKYISPILFWLPAFFGLAFPFLFALNLLFIVYWLAQFRIQAIFGIVLLTIALPTATGFLQISLKQNKQHKKQLRVTSYNSMLFDLYNWYHNHETRPRIFNSLSEINPDILCLQEFYTSEQEGDYNNIDTVKRLLQTPYYHSEYTTTLRDFDHWGIATFSKYPIVNQGKIVFNTSSNNICIFSDVVIATDTIRIYNIHLQSVGFSKKDNKFLNDVLSDNDANDEVDNGKNILRRLKRAFVKRAGQVNMIVTHMKTCRYKIILCGDFNDTAASFTYSQLTSELNDAFVEKGLGLGRTYAGNWPQFRIDYILHDKEIRCSSYKRAQETFTDHYPITAEFYNIAP